MLIRRESCFPYRCTPSRRAVYTVLFVWVVMVSGGLLGIEPIRGQTGNDTIDEIKLLQQLQNPDEIDDVGQTRGADSEDVVRYMSNLTLLARKPIYGSCLFLAQHISTASRQRHAVGIIEARGSDVAYDYQRRPGTRFYSFRAKKPGPAAVRRVIGDDYFQTAVRVAHRKGKIVNDELAGIRQLTSLRELYLSNCQMTDNSMHYLSGLKHLEVLHLRRNTLTDAGMHNLMNLTELEILSFSDNQITDASLKHLTKMKGLHKLFLHGNPIGDEGLVHLTKLKDLEMLGLARTQITDAAVEHLKSLTNLQYLGVTRTQLTPDAVKRLRSALPFCEVEY